MRLKISLKILANFFFIFSLFTPPRTFSTLFSFTPPMIPIICFFFFPSFFVNYIQQLFRLEPIQSFVSKHKIPSTGGCRNILKVFFTQHSRTISEISFYLKGLWKIYQNTSLILLLLKFCFNFTKIGLSRTLLFVYFDSLGFEKLSHIFSNLFFSLRFFHLVLIVSIKSFHSANHLWCKQ